MADEHKALSDLKHHVPGKSRTPQSIDWYAPGQTRVFDVEGVQIAVRYVGGKGRRGRIAVVTLRRVD